MLGETLSWWAPTCTTTSWQLIIYAEGVDEGLKKGYF